MHFSTTTLFLLYANSLMAFPWTNGDNDILLPNNYIEISRENITNGTLIYLGEPGNSTVVRKEVAMLEQRNDAKCKYAARLACDGKHNLARNNICGDLLNELSNDGTIPPPPGTLQLCYLGDAVSENPYCCVSWRNQIPGLLKSDLVNATTTILDTCTANGVSGKEYNIIIGNTCTAVCLSSRGTGC